MTTYTPEQRAEALTLYAKHGPGEAARRTGIKRGTISVWAQRAGVTCNSRETMAAAREVAVLTRQERTIRLSASLLAVAEREIEGLTKPVHTRKVAASGKLIEWDDLPEPADRRQMVTIAAIAIDKSQLLVGEATSRVERIEPAEAESEIQRLQAGWRERQAKKAS